MTTDEQRDLLPDLLRAWALIGIVLVNIELFSAPMANGYGPAASHDTVSHGLHFLINALFTLKSYSLFSLMFGAGLGYQIASAERAGTSLQGSYFRRMTALFLIGLLHAVFLFVGDILVTYAILGCVLYFCRNASQKALRGWGIVLILIQVLLLLTAALGMFSLESLPDSVAGPGAQNGVAIQNAILAGHDQVFAHGTFSEIARSRLALLPSMVPNILAIQGIAALGYFLLGLFAFRTGILREPTHRLWALSRNIFLPFGLVISCIGAALYVSAPERQSALTLTGMTIMMIGSPLSTFGYAGVIAGLCRKPKSGLLVFIARGGSATLSAYLLQSFILSFIYLDYGLGLFSLLSPASNILIALTTVAFSLIATSLWRLKFRYGPVELLLRVWTYGYRKSRHI